MKTDWMWTKLTSDIFSGACADAALVHIFAKCACIRGEIWLLPLGCVGGGSVTKEINLGLCGWHAPYSPWWVVQVRRRGGNQQLFSQQASNCAAYYQRNLWTVTDTGRVAQSNSVKSKVLVWALDWCSFLHGAYIIQWWRHWAQLLSLHLLD